jgi:Toastrack DUF4097
VVPFRELLSLRPGSFSWFVAAGLSASLAAACDVNIHDGKASVGVLSSQARDEWTHRYQLTPGGRVEVVNINGPTRLMRGDAGGVEVHATMTAKALTEAGAREILQRGRVQETSEAGRVRVETMNPRAIHGSYQVEYDVRVPPDAQIDVSVTNGPLNASELDGRLKVVAVNGRVELSKMAGSLDAVVANGSLGVDLDRVTADVRLELTNGRLSLTFPSSSKATLTARVVNGSLDVSGLGVEASGGRRVRTLETSLNGGGPAIDVRATNGRLSIEAKP